MRRSTAVEREGVVTGAAKQSVAELVGAGARGLCPECSAPTLFDGPVRFAERCKACGADFAKYNVGDGPAAFLTMIVGALVLGLALWVEFTFHPPVWVHALLWIPVTFGAVIGSLRVTKGMLLHLEHRNEAGEGRESK